MPDNGIETCEFHRLAMSLQCGGGDAEQFGRLVRVNPPGAGNENGINLHIKTSLTKTKTKQKREKKTSTPPAQIRRCDADVVIDTPSTTEFGITFDEITVSKELCRKHRTA